MSRLAWKPSVIATVEKKLPAPKPRAVPKVPKQQKVKCRK